jgi:hypothetical protein
MIKRIYTEHSKEYAELCHAKTFYLENLGRYDEAIKEEDIALEIYKNLLGAGNLTTLNAYLRVSSLIYGLYGR